MTTTQTDIPQRALVARLTELMAQQGMSASALSREAGVPRSTLQGWLSTGNPSIRGLQAIAKALGTDLVRITRGLA